MASATSIGSIFHEIRNSYRPLFLILVGVVALQFGFELQSDFFESNLIPHFLIVLLPLSVSVYSFWISKIYGGSKVFGRSYFAFGLGYFATFAGELLYVYFSDISGQEVPLGTDYFFFAFYLLVLAHLMINIRYFAEKISSIQKITIGAVPLVLTSGFTLLVFSNPVNDVSYFYYSLIFVILTSLKLGLVLVGFSLFRQTVLFSTWLLLLVGIFVGAIGDMSYHYAEILGGNWINEASSLWIGSTMVIIYALYKHHKSI